MLYKYMMLRLGKAHIAESGFDMQYKVTLTGNGSEINQVSNIYKRLYNMPERRDFARVYLSPPSSWLLAYVQSCPEVSIDDRME